MKVINNKQVAYQQVEQVLGLLDEAMSEVFPGVDYSIMHAASLITSIASGTAEHGYFAVALTDEGNVAGFFIGYMDKYAFSAKRFSSDVMLYVKPSMRHLGVSKLLIEDFVQWSKDKGASEMRLWLLNEKTKEHLLGVAVQHGFKEKGIVVVRGV